MDVVYGGFNKKRTNIPKNFKKEYCQVIFAMIK